MLAATATSETSPFQALTENLRGQVLLPTDPEYNQARLAWNRTVEQHPALVVIAEHRDDVVHAVRFAQQESLKIAVMATGHGTLREANDALLLVISKLNSVTINPINKTAWIDAGAKWAAVLPEAQKHGLAPLLGSTPDVGAVGYTLGGGMGWLARKYGMAVDSVLQFEVLTPDGEVCRASDVENPDLFWALRGGGGNFGVVLGMEIKLYPVTQIYGGNLLYPAAMAKEVFQHYNEWIAAAPDELTASIVLMNFPPMPQLPEFLRGQSVVMVRGAYVGLQAEGEALLKHWRDWQKPMIDDFKVLPFTDVALISNDPVEPSAGKGMSAWLTDMSDDAVDILIRYAFPKDGHKPIMVLEVRLAGGAIARVPSNSNAYGNRNDHFLMQVVGSTPTAEAIALFKQYTGELKQELAAHLTGGVYLNFLEGSEARARIKDAYTSENLNMLKAIKAKYDQTNLFSHSYDFNIATGSES